MVDSSPLHFDAAMANREARRCGTGTSSGAARSCGTASPQDIDAQCVRRCPEGSLLSPYICKKDRQISPSGLLHVIPLVCPCGPLCAILLVRWSVCPPSPFETNVATFVSDV